MAKNNDISITRTLMSVSKFLGKSAFIFFILSGIFIVVTINDAGINGETHQLQTDTLTTIDTFTIQNGRSYQLIMFPVNEEVSGQIYFILERQLIVGGVEVILESTNNGFLKTVYLNEGSYTVRAAFINEGFYAPTVQTEIMFATAENLNIALFGVTILFIVVFALSIGFFFALLPFTLTAMIISSVSKQNDRQIRYDKRARRDEFRAQRSEVRSASATIGHPTEQAAGASLSPDSGTLEPSIYTPNLNLFDPESYISRFTRKEWIMTGFMIFFLGLFFIEFESFGLVMALALLAWMIYSVNERERTKHRVLVLLSRQKETSVGFLAVQTSKKINYVSSVLQIMILDDGLPISMNANSGIVRTLGDLTPYIVIARPTTPYSQAPYHPSSETPVVLETEEEVETMATTEDSTYGYCANCGEQLPEFTKYCFICGTKHNS